jgi:hypothetical protein
MDMNEVARVSYLVHMYKNIYGCGLYRMKWVMDRRREEEIRSEQGGL